jgi:hypothetical protein
VETVPLLLKHLSMEAELEDSVDLLLSVWFRIADVEN